MKELEHILSHAVLIGMTAFTALAAIRLIVLWRHGIAAVALLNTDRARRHAPSE